MRKRATAALSQTKVWDSSMKSRCCRPEEISGLVTDFKEGALQLNSENPLLFNSVHTSQGRSQVLWPWK